MTTLNQLPSIAQTIAQKLVDVGFGDNLADLRVQQIIALAEEAGEFVGAARRYMGMARRSGTHNEMAKELADVVITAFVTAHIFDIDLPSEISDKLDIMFSRGWRS